ncbi:AbiH family protein [Porphyromonas sp.]
MNDIIILGNGFDLAHGLATGYKDYVRAMLIDSLIVKGGERSTYMDSPFKLSGSIGKSGVPASEFWEAAQKKNSELCELYNSVLEHPKDDESRFIERIIKDFENKGWVDLEETFFSILKESIAEDGIDKARIKALNKQMKELGDSLCKYLDTLQQPAPSEDIRTLFEQIKKEQIGRAHSLSQQIKIAPDEARVEAPSMEVIDGLAGITVLTFNYTDTCEALYKDTLTINTGDLPVHLADYFPTKGIPPTFIHIHGSLKEEEDIVLGYGDETTDKFRELEDANDNELTKYFKSFYYMKNPRYRQFFEVLERGPFRLHLMGHSCGLSDRVLLSSIFNHPNLEDVRIYYHDRGEGLSDYFQLCQNISRHFHDKHAMRRKILPCKGEDPNMMSVPLIPHKES